VVRAQPDSGQKKVNVLLICINVELQHRTVQLRDQPLMMNHIVRSSSLTKLAHDVLLQLLFGPLFNCYILIYFNLFFFFFFPVMMYYSYTLMFSLIFQHCCYSIVCYL